MTSRFTDQETLKTARQDWLSVLVRVPKDELIKAANQWIFSVVILKSPEVGLMMTNGRIHSTGGSFHVGEVSLTKCVLKDAEGHLGYGHILGRSHQQAHAVAMFDLALQRLDTSESAIQQLEKWRQQIDELTSQESARVEATRVDFFTMVRGET